MTFILKKKEEEVEEEEKENGRGRRKEGKLKYLQILKKQ